ncbi:hypothetical protein EDD16DRAFT_1524025 [Pisolithus croceorrhizus]|nr:hypothetical protein EDD16DRAFT_1524025 [Pisolithus croceorrhizus]KAI6166730.1 hypothetical protein EDD17DRAFT_1185504 [Pisolithus thermaeus]
MPLDGYTYLTSYGWTGKGTGLRNGAIEKPVAIPQKRNLAGVGKDRDEAFPFWDHLFAAASKAITIKVASDDDDENENDEDLHRIEPLNIKRTSTGIISNRRPATGTPTSESASGTATPDLYVGPKLSLIAAAKREAVKRGLYSRFFRGPVLGPDNDPCTCPTSATSASLASVALPEITPQPVEKKTKRRRPEGSLETKEERERKRLRRERKEARRLSRETKPEAMEPLGHQIVEAGDVNSLDRRSRLKPSKKKRKQVRENVLEVEQKGLVEEDNNVAMQADHARHVSTSGCENPSIELNSKKKKGKRKHSS